jgi:hypothetical protein
LQHPLKSLAKNRQQQEASEIQGTIKMEIRSPIQEAMHEKKQKQEATTNPRPARRNSQSLTHA